MGTQPPLHHHVGAKRLESVQVMRGIAASMVMLCHLTYANGNFQSVFPSFSLLFSYGWLGVTMFFVISGFVIPHGMDAMNYRIRSDAWPFFLRRLVRLEPPYIVSVFLAFTIAYAAAQSSSYHGAPFAPSFKEFLLQFLYIGPWFNVPFINDVAWTLAIEFQYYVLMLFAAPLILSPSNVLKVIFFSAVISLSVLVRDQRALFLYLPCFAVGFSIFLFYSQRIGVKTFVGLCGLFVALTALNQGIPQAVMGTISAGLILLPLNRPLPALSFFGTMSYSLYLVHTPVGDRVINLAMRASSNWVQLGGLVAGIGLSLFVAMMLWYFIERPSHLRAKRVLATNTRSVNTLPSSALKKSACNDRDESFSTLPR